MRCTERRLVPTVFAMARPVQCVTCPCGSELVNYRVNRNYYIVDRLFAAAELRLGDKDSERRVRIVRTDGRPRS